MRKWVLYLWLSAPPTAVVILAGVPWPLTLLCTGVYGFLTGAVMVWAGWPG